MAENLELLKRRLDRTFGAASPEVALERVRAIVGTARLPENAEGKLARDGFAALKAGETPTPKQLAALELMLRMMRPAPKIIDHQPEVLAKRFEPMLEMFPQWKLFCQALEPLAASVGRIDTGGKPLGTGFLVRENLVVTNRHVLDATSGGTRQLERGQAVILFGKEFESDDETPVDIVRVVAFHRQLDISLIEVDRQSKKALKVAAAGPAEGDAVVAVGFPFDDPVRNPLFISSIFGNKFGVKRAAPGDVVRVNAEQNTWGHDCSTLGGNSGSPLFSMATSEVVGVHFGGSFLWRNDAVDAAALAEFIKQNANI